MSVSFTQQDDLVFLIEIEPARRLDTESWTQDGTYTNCYYLSHPEGKPSRVQENGTDYTERASLSDCDSNASSWYYDSSSNRLYVHTSGSDDPGGGSYIIASYWWEYYTNKQYVHPDEIVFNGKFYLPFLDDASIPEINLAISDFSEGGIQKSIGPIRLINADGYFDQRLHDYIYMAKKILIKIGKKGASYNDYITLWNGWTGNITWMDLYIEIAVEDLRKFVL